MSFSAAACQVSLSAAQARRIFLNAQQLARGRPRRTPTRDDFRRYLQRQGVLQLDTVNVLARAHYVPFFSRLGPFDQSQLDGYLWGSGETFEYWGHEASVMPRELLPALHHRMQGFRVSGSKYVDRIEDANPGLFQRVRAAVEFSGPLTPRDVAHLAPARRPPDPWWDYSDVKAALEYLSRVGHVAAGRTKNFHRTYDAPTRAWGCAGADSADDWAVDSAQALAILASRALSAVGIGTAADIADHFRMPVGEVRTALAQLVESGEAQCADVEGWPEAAYLAPDAHDPERVTGVALLNPFDPVIWYRPRLKRMFGMDYRIEIYTPAAKRVYGYYTLPLLVGDQIVGRFDLKADRRAQRLLVSSAWREAATVPGAGTRTNQSIATAAQRELRLLASWLGLDDVVVEPHGNFAAALTPEGRRSG
ncbi:MAG: winged helix-turn-helix domain-containing protein [Arachnia sp.]